MSISTIAQPRRLFDFVRAILSGDGDHAHARRGAVLAFTIRVVSAGLAYASQVLLARWMGAHDYGIFAYCWVWLTILGVLAPVGLNTSVLRFLPEYRKRGELGLLHGLIRGSRITATAIATAIAATGCVLVWLTDGIIAADYAVPLYLMLACLPLFSLGDVNEGIARSQSWLELALLPPYVVRPVILLAALALAVASGLEATATTAVAAAIVATWVTAIGQQILVSRRIAGTTEPHPRTYSFPFWLKVSGPIFLVEGFFTALSNTDVIILNLYLGPAESAIYYAALKTTTLISFIYYAVTTAFAHRISHYNAAGDREALARMLRDAVTWTFWPSLAAASLILALGWPLLWLFGEGFTAAYPVMFILVVGLLARAAVGPIEYMLSMQGEEKVCAGALLLAASVNIALNFALIPAFGLIGAAAATATSTVLATVLLYALAERRLGLRSIIWTPRRSG